MRTFRREASYKLRVLRHAAQYGDISQTCRYFGIGGASFYRWKTAFGKYGEAGLENRSCAPKNPANQKPAEIVDKVLHLRTRFGNRPVFNGADP